MGGRTRTLTIRTGIGYDIHRLEANRKLLLGGVEIPYIKGLLGYSDGDVVLHAASDAILGALGKGDIGQHFPNTDPQYKDYPSTKILKKVNSMVSDEGMIISNVDITVIAEEPKIHPFRDKMRESVARMLELDEKAVNIKATTNEGVGSIGRGEAISCYAIVAITKK